MKERIDINVEERRLHDNPAKHHRLTNARSMRPVDRVPVVMHTDQWTALNSRGVTFADYIADARANMRQQILNHKWLMENIHDDTPVETRAVTVKPDFASLRGMEFPCEIIWHPDQPAKTVHLLKEATDIDALALPEPGGGLNVKRIAWYREMLAMREDFDLRLNGQPLQINVDIAYAGGPIPVAFALAGENLFMWMYDEPERVHKLMALVTQGVINGIEFFDQMTGRESRGLWLGCDAAEMLSPAMYREFVVPYYNRVWERFPGGRTLHMCGKIDHLLEIIRDEMAITCLDTFGFPLDINRLSETIAGRIALRGGPGPMLIYDGPPEAIVAKCLQYIKTIGTSGYILDSGGAIRAGTPPPHIEAMIEASRRAGAG